MSWAMSRAAKILEKVENTETKIFWFAAKSVWPMTLADALSLSSFILPRLSIQSHRHRISRL